MPHIVVKMYPGRTEDQKIELTARIVDAVMETLNVGIQSISVGIEEIPPEKWAETVYKPEIIGKKDTLYKKPGYKPE